MANDQRRVELLLEHIVQLLHGIKWEIECHNEQAHGFDTRGKWSHCPKCEVLSVVRDWH